MEITIKNLFDLAEFQYPQLFEGLIYPWEAVAKLSQFLLPLTKEARAIEFPGAFIGPNVLIGEGTIVEPGAVIYGPTVIGKNCKIRSGAYIRGNVLVGDDSVVGHATEVKNSILLGKVRVDHFNYIADSILGFKAHMGAGSILANSKISPGEIVVKNEDKSYPTALNKFGAALGDSSEIGSNAVLNPGSIIGKSSVVYPLVSWRGVLPENRIAKTATETVERK